MPNLTGKGYLKHWYDEPRAKKPIQFRLPQSIDEQARAIAGDNLVEFAQQAIIEKIEREQKKSTFRKRTKKAPPVDVESAVS